MSYRVALTKSMVSREEFNDAQGADFLMSALTGNAGIAKGSQAVMNMRNEYASKGGENVSTDMLGLNPDGTARGGYLPVNYARTFMEWASDSVPFLPLITQMQMPSHTTVLSRIGLGDRVMHGSSELQQMSDAQKARLLYGAQEMTTKKYMGQIDISYETLRNNIEQGNLRSRIMRLLSGQWGADTEYVVLNSDVNITATHPVQDWADHWDLLNKQDGFIKRCMTMRPSGRPGEGKVGANRIDGGGTTIDNPKWYSLEYALPEKYRRDNNPYLWLTSRVVDLNWRQYLTDRPTSVGDMYMFNSVTNPESRALGLNILTCPQLPVNIEVVGDDVEQGDYALLFLMQPRNVVLGWWQQLMVESTRDIERQVYKIVLSMYMGFTIMQPDAIAMCENIGVHY